jgi:hypothetical protein
MFIKTVFSIVFNIKATILFCPKTSGSAASARFEYHLAHTL